MSEMTLEEAIKHLRAEGAFSSHHAGLTSMGQYLSWAMGEDTACLDGQFTAKDLLAIATFMEEAELVKG